jgi:hypothetical protein
MPTYMMRAIDETLWNAFKKKATAEGRGLRYVVLRLIELYSHVGLDTLEKAAGVKPANLRR